MVYISNLQIILMPMISIFSDGLSLYQYINRASTEKGQQTLAQWLLHPADAKTITERQAR
jgi:DNA mismatch repair ATPase MutS